MNDKIPEMALGRGFRGRFRRLRRPANPANVYAYTPAGNRKYEEKLHDPNNSQLYKYDTIYQVDKFKSGKLNRPKTNIIRPDRRQDWNYDPMGNWRRFLDSEDGLQRRNHNEVNELTEIMELGPRRPRRPVKTALSYDPNGNLIDDGEFLYAWDAFNRLVEVRLKADSSLIIGQYFYDAMHRRTKRHANLDHNTTLEIQATYVYDGFNCIFEIFNFQSVITPKAYVWGNDISGSPQSAGGVGGLVAVLTFSPQPSAFFPLFDARGNATAYTDSSGALAATFDYLPFGALANATGTADLFSYRFSTKPFDPETGLVYYNFRYYSPELGRWMSRDQIGEEGGYNLYAMVGNVPINICDNLGNFPKNACGPCCGAKRYNPSTQCCKDGVVINDTYKQCIERHRVCTDRCDYNFLTESADLLQGSGIAIGGGLAACITMCAIPGLQVACVVCKVSAAGGLGMIRLIKLRSLVKTYNSCIDGCSPIIDNCKCPKE